MPWYQLGEEANAYATGIGSIVLAVLFVTIAALLQLAAWTSVAVRDMAINSFQSTPAVMESAS